MPLDVVFIGTYTAPGRQIGRVLAPGELIWGMADPTGARGIYVYRRDRASGALSLLQEVDAVNPTFLTLDPTERFLFAAIEVRDYAEAVTGGLHSYAVDPETGVIRFLSEVASKGRNPCYLSVTADGRFLLVANHEDGTVAVMPIAPDGKLSEAVDVKVDERIDDRQPHAHFAAQDPSARFVLTTDTGTDRIMVYRLDPTSGRLMPHEPPFSTTHHGGTPRHLAFHPGGRHVFVNGEGDRTLSLFRFDAESGTLHYLNCVSTVPEGTPVSGHSTAQMLAHPDGRFVYVANRGSNTIAIIAFDAQREKMAPVGFEPTRGHTPRHFQFDPSGSELYVANQVTSTLERFLIDRASGLLRHTGQVATVPVPTCILFTKV